MKKIIAAAVAAAFVAPAFAADVTLSGSMEFNMNDTNGTTASATDAAFKVAASSETANGISVSADINIQSNDNTVAGNGGDSLTLSGPFGKVDMGDTSSAADNFDDRVDYSLLNGVATSAGDAALGWTLPTIIEGATVYVSHAADSGEGDKHTGIGIEYSAGPIELAYAKNDEEASESNLTYAGLTATFQGLAVSIESMEDEGGSSAATVDEDTVGATYTMGDITVYMANYESKTGGTKDSEVSSWGLQYDMGGDVTFFIEGSQDDLNSAADATGAGIVMAF
jgi:hypothetical protein